MHVDGALARGLVVGVPQVVDELVAVDGAALAEHEVLQQLELLVGEAGGLAVEEHIPFENDGDFADVSMHIVEVRLPDGETTGVMLPKGETFRPGAPMKIEHFRRAFGPVKFEWHTFAGYADEAK